MRIAITGTPGTGKTSVSKRLAERLNYKLFSIEDIADKNDLYESYDEKRDTYVIDERKLNRALRKEIKNTKNFILEGHLAHFFKNLDLVIILRTNPGELEKRLEAKGWNKNKVIENVQAEILDIILQESFQKHKEICEIETSKKTAGFVAKEIENIIKNPDLKEKFRPGKINWSGYFAYF